MSTARIQEQLVNNNDEIELVIATERNRDMKQLQENTQQLRAVMTDLAKLTAEQQVDLDNIDKKIVKSVDNQEAGIRHLDNASKRTNRKRWMTAITVGVLSIGAGLLGGYPLGMALGYSGMAATFCGFGIIAGVILTIALVSFAVYAIYHLIKEGREKLAGTYDPPPLRTDTPVTNVQSEKPTHGAGLNFGAGITSRTNIIKTGLAAKQTLGL